MDKALSLEIIRKTLSLAITAALVWGGVSIKEAYGLQAGLNGLFALLVVFLAIDYLRIDLGLSLPIYRVTQRDKELLRLHGLTFYLIAAIIVFSVFEFEIALCAILMSVFCDAASSIVGRSFGRHRIWREKSIEGSLAGLVANMVVGFVMLESLQVIMAMALVASAVELLSDKIDDNLMVTVYATLAGHIASMV